MLFPVMPQSPSLTTLSGAGRGAWACCRLTQVVGSSEVHRLTTDPAADVHPVWSPDGRQIAFLRWEKDTASIHLVSPLGGAARKRSGQAVEGPLSWSSDGEWIAAASPCPVEATPEDCGAWAIPVTGATRGG